MDNKDMDQSTSSTTTSVSTSDDSLSEWSALSQSSQTSIIVEIKRFGISCDQSAVDTIALLDDYSLLTIFSKLSFVEKLMAQNVCQRWHRLVHQSLRCQTSIGVAISIAVCADRRHHVLSDECIGSVFDRGVDSITNTKSYFVNGSQLSTVLSKCPNLKSLILQNCMFCRQVVDVFVRDCSAHLEHLDLSRSSCNINEILKILSEKCKQTLRHVILEENGITDFALNCLIDSCKELEILILDKNNEISGHCFDLFGDKIRFLSIVDCDGIGETGVNAMVSGNGRHVTHLRLGDNLKPSMFETICQTMTALKILEFKGFKADAAEGHSAYTFIGHVTCLEELVLTVPHIPFDTQLTSIVSRTRAIRKLEIDGAIISNASLVLLANNCPLLQQLSINASHPLLNRSLTDECGHALASLCHLMVLSLCGASITDQFVGLICLCPRLKTIELNSCKAITNASLNVLIQTANTRPNERLMAYIESTKITKTCEDIPLNLILVGLRNG